MDYELGQLANNAVSTTEKLHAAGSAFSFPEFVNALIRRPDSSHSFQRPLRDSSVYSLDELRSLLVEVCSSLVELTGQHEMLEGQNQRLQQANAELEKSNTRIANLLKLTSELANVGGWELNLESNASFLTQETYRIHEIDEAQPLTLDGLIDFFSPESRPVFRAALETALATGCSWDLELPVVTRKANSIWVRTLGEVVHEKGIAVKLLGAMQVITERKRVEAARAALESRLRESQKLESMGSLAGGIAHDFNNILAAVMGNADIARMTLDDPEETRRCLQEITKASERGRDLVRQILSFSRPRSTERKWISIGPVVDDSVRLLRATLPARVALIMECGNDLPKVLVDATQISQVIINLVTNAFQAMAGKPGNVSVKVESLALDSEVRKVLPQIDAMSKEYDRVLRLVVADDGPGMAPSTIDHLFEPYFTTKANGEGTGLGLTVVQGIVRTHQGAIKVDSRLGCGSTFKIYLPAASVASSQEGHAESELVSAPPEAGARPRVLYVDDDLAVLQSLSCFLLQNSFFVSSFSDQNAALKTIREDISQFDVIVVDYNMPRIGGIEIARIVRSLSAEVPIVIVTGLIDDALRTAAAQIGIQELIAKPFSLGSLCNALHRVVANRTPVD